MIYSSADIIRVLGCDAIIRQEARLSVVDGKPGLGFDEYVYIYIDKYPTVEEFQATWKIWVVNGGSDLLDLVLNAMTALLPNFDFSGEHYTTTDFASEKTVTKSEAEKELEATRAEREQLQSRFSGLQKGLEDRLSTVRDGVDGRDGKDGLNGLPGKDGKDGRDGRDIIATETDLEDLANVEQGITKENGQVLTWKDGKWQNLFIPQIVSSISGSGGGGGTTINQLNDIGDVDVPAPNHGDVLSYDSNSGNWVSAAAPPADISGNSIDDLSDVDTSTSAPSLNQALVWDGSNWVPGDVASSGLQPGDNVSELVNDANYITQAELESADADGGYFGDLPNPDGGYFDDGSTTSLLDYPVDGGNFDTGVSAAYGDSFFNGGEAT